MPIQIHDAIGSLQRLTINQGANREVSGNGLREAIYHLFLPKQTPGALQSNLPEIEQFCLQTFHNSITDAIVQTPFPQLYSTQLMLEKWIQIQPNDYDNFRPMERFRTEIPQLSNGQSLPIYVRKQNGTLLITKQAHDGAIKIATFRSSLPSETVMTTVGSLSLTFPETQEIIHNTELLTSTAFLQQLHELAVGDVDICQGTKTKGGSEYKETRDVTDPRLVSDWIIGLLVPASTSGSIPSQQIRKKIRDQVNLADVAGSSASLPFRRSGLYMSFKACLQLKLLEVFGYPEYAKLVYKTLLLRILADVTLQFWKAPNENGPVDMDLTTQMLSKLGIRALKLEALTIDFPTKLHESIWKSVMDLKTKCLEHTEAIVKHISSHLHQAWNNIARPLDLGSEDKPGRSGSSHDGKDLHHHLPLLDNFIDKLRISAAASNPNITRDNVAIADSQTVARYPTIKSIEEASISKSTAPIWLHDTENFIKYQCHIGSIPASSMSKLLITYVDRARSHYEKNPIGISQMFLVSLKAMQLVDKVATASHPLLLEYKPGINLGLFDHLLLPYRKDMELLDELLNYFRGRETNAEYPGILKMAAVKSDSFSVQYAARSGNMKQLRTRILLETEAEIAKKYEEVDSMRRRCNGIRAMIAAEATCKCIYEEKKVRTRSKKNWTTRSVLISTCRKCTLDKHLDTLRCSVTYYEKPVPPEDVYQYAVVFELLIPELLATWRDLLAYFVSDVLGEPIFEDVRSTLPKKWLDYSKISSYKLATINAANVSLGSTVMSTSSTYHTRTQALDVTRNTNEDYIRNNGMNCTFQYSTRTTPTKSVKTACTFQLNTAQNSIPYKSLQSTLLSTAHSQNSIMARQSECHQKLALHEFIAFGSLRAGHRIQLRNLFEAIFSGRLSLEQEPVLTLILQTIWQVGPANAVAIRESHLDFQDNVFGQEFLEMLDKLVKTNEANYSNTIILLISVIITTRIADLNDSLKASCYSVLRSWRNIMTTWINKIQAALDKPETASVHGGIDSLRKNLLEVVLCSLYSFSTVDESNLGNVMKDEADVMHWLQTMYQLRQLDDHSMSTSEFLKTLLGFAKRIPINLALEKKLAAGDPVFIKSIRCFICERWNKAKECSLQQMKLPLVHKYKEHIFLAKYLEVDPDTGERVPHDVTIDMLMGTFLVNGYTQSSLPLQVRDHKLFLRYFGKDGATLRVQRDNAFVTRTVTEYHGRHYEFHHNDNLTSSPLFRHQRHFLDPTESDTVIIIKEIKDASTKYVLLDPDIFSECISDYFIANYTHWLDPKANVVHFRPLEGDDPHSHHFQLRGVPSTKIWTLYDVRSQEHIYSIQSPGFRTVTGALSRLEVDHYINVTLNASNFTTATLRRHNLRFTIVQNDGRLESVEYPGFHVSMDQKSKGTLIGLHQGLLLENGEKRLLLIPHSSISVHQGTCHQNSSISLDNLRQPPSFVYEFDDVLKRLRAHNNKSAWLYLAALHAVTSSPLPDPFTDITGTEMAVRILQSACVWSCSPYDNESIATLEFIKGLSPRRKYYGYAAPKKRMREDKGSMEITKWPRGMPSMGSYDGYAIIVGKLLAESEKLSMLHSKSTEDKDEDDDMGKEKLSETLRIRAYSRYLAMYNPAVAVENPSYFSDSQSSLLTNGAGMVSNLSLRRSSQDMNLANLQSISFARLTNVIKPFIQHGHFVKNNLASFLITEEQLDAPFPGLSLSGYEVYFQDLFHLDFRSSWLKLYAMAISCDSREKINQFSIILAALAYRGAPLEQVANLHCISIFRVNFPPVSSLAEEGLVPSYGRYPSPKQNIYDMAIVEDILNRNAKHFPGVQPTAPSKPSTPAYRYSASQYVFIPMTPEEINERQEKYNADYRKYEEDLRNYYAQKKAYEDQIQRSVKEMSRSIRTLYWPGPEIPIDSISRQLENYNIHGHAAGEINEYVAFWYRNYKLQVLIESVQQKLGQIFDALQANTFVEQPAVIEAVALVEHISQVMAEDTRKIGLELQIEQLIDSSSAPRSLTEAITIFEGTRQLPCTIINPGCMNEIIVARGQCEGIVKEFIAEIRDMLTSKNVSKRVIDMAGLSPRLDPISILRYLMRNVRRQPTVQTNIITEYAGALGVLWTQLKRMNRCIRAQNPSDVQREMDNPGHQNWSPTKNPEWLLLELELDIMIRSVQVKVAQQMITMPNGGNGVTQLNMGEGKTSVIVPMLCCTLAQNSKQLCRVTVLSSMFNMNLTSLAFSIGGLVNRRVYSVPCRRDMEIDENCVDSIGRVYKECLEMRGVLLTLPEYRLSFRLLAYDNMLKKNGVLGQKMLAVENFLREYARDVLDESDELFHVKYQLVYTIGEQVPVDGGDLRWTTCQRILAIVQKMAHELLDNYGTSMVEFDKISNQTCPHQFSTFRLLDTDNISKFMGKIADKFLEEVMITTTEKTAVTRFLTQVEISPEDHSQVVNGIFKDSPDELNKILLISGYLRKGILGLALTKRWRVEYGVNPKVGFRRMAVPFRAKDVAAEKTEFGHPDLAIVLTHLSYYYSGLDDMQLTEVMEILRRKQAPDAIYSHWVDEIPETHIPDFLRKYYCLNMKDAYQKSKLFDMLRRHKMVVDFWLSHCVFPRESKQFPGKLVMTAWDLCYERQRFPVTGFSGTNDSKILLPLMITQQDLPELQSTNAKMERTLLQPENKGHKGFPMGVTCGKILETMKQDNLTVLIDAGALMLECSNEQVADLWLSVDTGIEAAVYFSKDNELLVKCRGDTGQGTPFNVSPYQGRLDKCGVFLDDQHTRGTDLKFPLGSRACVTIATRMKRDKLIQACMRMRKLGQGHYVTFYLSHEARDKVLEQYKSQGVIENFARPRIG